MKSIVKGVMISMVTTLIFLLFFSFIFATTNIKEQFINSVIIIVSGISILLGTFLAARKTKNKGFIFGIIISLIYMGFLYLVSSLLSSDFSLSSSSIVMIVMGIILGIVGGIIGVNIKK